MPRKPRIEYEGAVYHVMSRGNRQASIYNDDTDRERFLETLADVCTRTGWIVHSYVLMSTHYHLLLETPEGNLVIGMKWLQGTYTQRFNARHREWGHLFQGRYKALVIDNDSDDYFPIVSTYIHLNPARAKMFDLINAKLSDYHWSSYPLYLRPSKRPSWLSTDQVFNCLHMGDDRRGRSEYRQYMQNWVAEIARSKDPRQLNPDWKNIRRGWFLGCDSFKERLLDRIEELKSDYKSSSFCGTEIRLHNERQAKRLLSIGMKQLNVTEKSLELSPKGSPKKRVLAWYIRKRTIVSNEWLALHLKSGHSANISRLVSSVNDNKNKELQRLKRILLKCKD